MKLLTYKKQLDSITIAVKPNADLQMLASIKKSLQQLASGMDNFFDFLNFKSSNPKKIEINSKDELYIMANKINRQIKLIELNLNPLCLNYYN